MDEIFLQADLFMFDVDVIDFGHLAGKVSIGENGTAVSSSIL